MAADKKAKAPEGEASGSKKKLIIMIGIGVLLVVVSIGGTVGALKFLSPAKESAEAEEETASSEHGAEAAAIYYPLKPNFTVNYDVNGRQRFLQTELTFMYRDPGLLKTLELHMPAVRNSLVLLLSSQVFDDLQTVEGKEKLREEALEAVQEILAREQEEAYARMSAKEKEAFKKEHGRDGANIEQVLFTNFVMQ